MYVNSTLYEFIYKAIHVFYMYFIIEIFGIYLWYIYIYIGIYKGERFFKETL